MGNTTILGPIEAARKIAWLACDVAEDKQASDILMLDLVEESDFTYFFVILSADSPRHIESIASDVDVTLRLNGVLRHHREGDSHGGWVLLDFGDVVVHIFHSSQRQFYDLEGAWRKGKEVVRIQ